MPLKNQAQDWDRLFDPNAPRRGGPLQILVVVIVVTVILGVLGFVAQYALANRARQNEERLARATSMAATLIPQQTAAALSEAATQAVIQTATAAIPTPGPILGTSIVIAAGNLRSEPIIAQETVSKLLAVNDQVEVLSQREINGQTWYYLRVTAVSAGSGDKRAVAGDQGWVNATLLAPLTPLP